MEVTLQGGPHDGRFFPNVSGATLHCPVIERTTNAEATDSLAPFDRNVMAITVHTYSLPDGAYLGVRQPPTYVPDPFPWPEEDERPSRRWRDRWARLRRAWNGDDDDY